jgi:hypothetical protein
MGPPSSLDYTQARLGANRGGRSRRWPGGAAMAVEVNGWNRPTGLADPCGTCVNANQMRMCEVDETMRAADEERTQQCIAVSVRSLRQQQWHGPPLQWQQPPSACPTWVIARPGCAWWAVDVRPLSACPTWVIRWTMSWPPGCVWTAQVDASAMVGTLSADPIARSRGIKPPTSRATKSSQYLDLSIGAADFPAAEPASCAGAALPAGGLARYVSHVTPALPGGAE